MLKRIFAVVSDADFYACQQRARNEGMDLGECFAALVHAYAKGDKMDVKRYHSRFHDLHAQDDAENPQHKRLSEVQGEQK